MLDVSILIQALPYIRAFRDKLFVVKIGGELLREHDQLDAIAGDLTLAHMVGIQLIVVHGGGPQANELSTSLGFEPKLVGGRRVTDERALEVAKMVFAGKINTELLSALGKHGGRAVGLSGVDAGLIRAHRRPVTRVVENGEVREVDFGFVGDIDAVDPDVLDKLTGMGFIPVVSSLAADDDGTILNVNADTIAAEIAAGMRAEKLIVMTSVPGVYKAFGKSEEVYSVLDVRQARALIEDGTAARGMRPKLEACARAVERGVAKAHIINGLTRHSLLMEIFTNQGIGTMLIPGA
ncbi:MAG: acetylglutamate kinase [Planctomycetota bacterium]|nr:MAG: acetylglutamate kinase [Planctomycetota bacterium]